MDLEFSACLLASFSMLRPGTGRGPEERWGPQCAPHPVIGSEYLIRRQGLGRINERYNGF